jgi:solute carrier family 25 iron transporter 28/37
VTHLIFSPWLQLSTNINYNNSHKYVILIIILFIMNPNLVSWSSAAAAAAAAAAAVPSPLPLVVSSSSSSPSKCYYLGHFDDYDEVDEADESSSNHIKYWQAMVAGSSAGVMEHIFMFPIDTIKTRMQAQASAKNPNYQTISSAITSITRTEGVGRLYRGVTAVVAAAIPSHAVHFGVYELVKHKLIGSAQAGHYPLYTAIAGAAATCAHDAVVTPLDVVKQRLQMENSPYSGVLQCVKSIIRREGWSTFYASYPTTVIMNIPFMMVHFVVYESMKQFISHDSKQSTLKEQIIAGGTAGAAAGFISTPFDVVKTRIQTQQEAKKLGAIEIVKQIYREERFKGFLRGGRARVLYFLPSSAICFTTYETVKRLLKQYS